jgi:hypothetical protein
MKVSYITFVTIKEICDLPISTVAKVKLVKRVLQLSNNDNAELITASAIVKGILPDSNINIEPIEIEVTYHLN